ncbi:3-dehydroquinate dehydratase-like protein [Thermochaetoides thermophila DSM 1495]|uniref:3-dehydroquinate dehydratase-like protein n=1 Tax=Chaetomium thermophilum (strain DSM 1495 / CBS 144.50 / IMI 039719) TaxID=759272 RepID=G0SEC2_CHATD|nr:3-dehydroquinate dehydratase-like protein [Thermochaetoides thermophila DSM 1495]EGS18299.1 3-dehydroquinate dehydratase-like protein [Thermochaetoides thermophila DSM 1495]
MAAVQQLEPVPTPAGPQSINDETYHSDADMGRESPPAAPDLAFGSGPQRGDTRIVVVIYGPGQDKIVATFAEVLGKRSRLKTCFKEITAEDQDWVVGLPSESAKVDIAERDRRLVVAINAHCTTLGMPPDVYLSAQCDYEFLYTETPFFRRDLARFVSHVLGQISHHETLMAKPRTYFISTTFPDVHAALPNIDILTVGSDAVEIRVDLLKEPRGDGTFSEIPSLSYVGEQVMLLRQRTELPIIFTTRCTKENGRFPMDNPDLYYEYLYRAIQWGIEYIDVELWLPERIRKKLYEQRGNSRIMSAFHDFSGTFKWTSTQAEAIFEESKKYADIVKMIAIINDHNENFELEYFRSKIRSLHPNGPPLSAVNMGETGQFSRTLNKCFTPITHPLLPIIAAPGQMSAAEINQALALLGQLPKKNMYGITSPAMRSSTPQAPFYEKCFNELGLPHQFVVVEWQPKAGCIGAWVNQRNFGGAYLNPAVSIKSLLSHSSFLSSLNNGVGPVLSEAARLIGVVDTIVVRQASSSTGASATASIPSSPPHTRNGGDSLTGSSTLTGSGAMQSGLPPNTSLILDNASWKGILSTLIRDLAPSAYFGCAAVVLASSAEDAASALFALKALKVGKVYTVGFKTPPAFGKDLLIEPFTSLESIQRARTIGGGAEVAGSGAGSPFLVVSALGPEKSALVGMLVRLFGSRNPASSSSTSGGGAKKVFLDLADRSGMNSVGKGGDPAVIAEQSGFAAYGAADVAAFTTVETLRLLVGQNVPYSFVRLASGRTLF